jgi:hypothetical protein
MLAPPLYPPGQGHLNIPKYCPWCDTRLRSHHEIFRAGALRLAERPQWRGGLAVICRNIGRWAKELSALFHYGHGRLN